MQTSNPIVQMSAFARVGLPRRSACGGLGMLLGAYLRSSNRSAMYNGADLQIWFGVFGRRWGLGLGSLNLSFVKAWKRPGAAEVPTGALLVEGGAYW